MQRPLTDQSPKRVGSSPFGPPTSSTAFGGSGFACAADSAAGADFGIESAIFLFMNDNLARESVGSKSFSYVDAGFTQASLLTISLDSGASNNFVRDEYRDQTIWTRA